MAIRIGRGDHVARGRRGRPGEQKQDEQRQGAEGDAGWRKPGASTRRVEIA